MTRTGRFNGVFKYNSPEQSPQVFINYLDSDKIYSIRSVPQQEELALMTEEQLLNNRFEVTRLK